MPVGPLRFALVLGLVVGAGCSSQTGVDLALAMNGPSSQAADELELDVVGDQGESYSTRVLVVGKFAHGEETLRYLSHQHRGSLTFTASVLDRNRKRLASGSATVKLSDGAIVHASLPLAAVGVDTPDMGMSVPDMAIPDGGIDIPDGGIGVGSDLDIPATDLGSVPDLSPNLPHTDPPRPLAPLNGGMARVLRPTFKWKLPANSTGAHVQICDDRACKQILSEFDASGDHITAPFDIGTSHISVVFWRTRSLYFGFINSDWSPLWQFRTAPAESTGHVDTAYGLTLDLDGDGSDDLCAGWRGGVTDVGKAFVYFGHDLLLNQVELDEPTPGPGNLFGLSNSVAGDVDGDGYIDLLVGAPYTPYDATNHAAGPGAAYLFYGGPDGPLKRPPLMIPAPESARGTPSGMFGLALAGVGDLDADGYADFIIGAPGIGHAYVYHGGAAGPALEPAYALTDSVGLSGFGAALAEAGDLDGNGYPDLIVGAPWVAKGTHMSGSAYVYLNTSKGLPAWPTYSFNGWVDVNEQIGTSIDGAADLDGDGYADFVAGAPGSGRAYVFWGGHPMAGAPALVLGDTGGADLFGGGVKMLNFDCGPNASVIVGAPRAAGGGSAWYFDKLVSSTLARGLVTPLVPANANADGDRFGGGIAGGDFTGDGCYDVLIGAPLAGTGKVYPFQGSSMPANPIKGIDFSLFSGAPTTGTFGVGNFGGFGTY